MASLQRTAFSTFEFHKVKNVSQQWWMGSQSVSKKRQVTWTERQFEGETHYQFALVFENMLCQQCGIDYRIGLKLTYLSFPR